MQEGQPLEGPIDPETYRLGPGDVLGVFITGDVEEELLARIGADGLLRLRSLGIFDTRDKFFAEIRSEILKAARKSYKANNITISILELRNFKASVGGMVWAPGTYNMTAADRVVSLLARAGGFYNPARREQEAELTQVRTVIEREQKKKEEEKIPELPSYSARRTQITHKDGTKETVDLLLFLRAGMFEGNPYLRDGDFLLVPPLNPQTGVVGVYGAVNDQGMVEHLDGDNLEKILLLSGGLISSAMRDSVEITRFVGGTADYETFVVNLDSPTGLETPIYPDDRVYVRNIPEYHPRHQVELRGEFMKPGYYPVSSQGTSVREIIEAAGGFTHRASLKEATLTRKMGIELVDPEYERLMTTSVADMKPLEYQYFKTKSRESKGQVVIDLYSLFVDGDSTQNVLLRNEDILEVPPITEAVNVTGQVKQPGIVTYLPGKDYKYYIEQSGGFSWNAKKGKIRVIKALSGKWVKPKHTIIEEGDTIFIPEKAEIDYWQTYKDVMLVLTQFATLYLLVVTINRQ